MRRVVLFLVMMTLLVITAGCEVKQETNPVTTSETIETTELVTEIEVVTQNELINFDDFDVKTDDGMFQVDLFKGYRVDLEEPNKYVLMNENNTNVFARIEWLDGSDTTTIEELKSSLVEAYESIGTVTILLPEDFQYDGLNNAVFALNIVQANASESKIDIAVFYNAASKYIVSIYYSGANDEVGIIDSLWRMVETIQPVE